MASCTSKQTKIKKYFRESRNFEFSLQIEENTVEEIRNTFFFKNQGNKITIKNAQLCLLSLIKTKHQTTEAMIQKFFEFQKLPTDDENINFESMILIMFILSKSTRNQKASAIFQLFDHEIKGYLTKEEFTEMFQNILTTLLKISIGIQKCLYSEKIIDQKNKSIEDIVVELTCEQQEKYCQKLIQKLIIPNFFKELTQISHDEFINKMENINFNFCYDLLTTTGLRDLFCKFMKQELTLQKERRTNKQELASVLTSLKQQEL